ncbi:hypothetical protein [Cellulomonas chengniuliangii]|uniref:UDP-N-acetylmuramyl pentapeptide phosphotransferase/UDP-N-acetylglucosamine-1-phosphate transferase n=1 Tax=Cellulomonas chengniuliangii TaxID=2968084 RepID=A0ABY5KX80_9CELL|nr:hypothetical protein [Cellulomonas chengniuliangii]MCC2308714.1 hypothetical protein [Cellulomonas chengniuliangii]UUI74066.1 hypothetical protein NP064_09470 [Cellulomonas chengniuliangii]
MTVGLGQRVVAGLAASSVTLAVRGALDEDPPGGSRRWTRMNHRGEPVSLLSGPAAAAGLIVGGALGAPTPRAAVASSVATLAGATFGLVDDLAEDQETRAKGLRGHLGALREGRLTTGALKVLGIGAGALVAAAVATPGRGADGSRRAPVAWAADVAASGALIAATANLVNLLDLRPGRALKAVGLAAAPMALAGGAGSGAAAAVVGAASAGIEADLAERDMLGDGGANALGAMLGAAVVLDAPRPVRLALLAGAVGLTVASERVSFTQVIARTPVLRELDGWGRRPMAPAAPVARAGDESRGA